MNAGGRFTLDTLRAGLIRHLTEADASFVAAQIAARRAMAHDLQQDDACIDVPTLHLSVLSLEFQLAPARQPWWRTALDTLRGWVSRSRAIASEQYVFAAPTAASMTLKLKMVRGGDGSWKEDGGVDAADDD